MKCLVTFNPDIIERCDAMKNQITPEEKKYLQLLAEKYPTTQAVCTEIINLNAILNLPKGTEHFMSDLHGEYEAFCHILNNCSGVIREKVTMLYNQRNNLSRENAGFHRSDILEDNMTKEECQELCTLIYYPKEKLEALKKEGKINDNWYKKTIGNLNELSRMLSSKYTRSKVRKCMPKEYQYILDELLHMQKDEDNNQYRYHEQIIETLIQLNSCDDFIEAYAEMLKKLAVDYLHIVGDIFDRGPRPDAILDMLKNFHALDIEWGNHDILWMGAAAGSQACMATVVRNSLSYHNMDVLEKGYGVSLRPLALFAEHTYKKRKSVTEMAKIAISIILFKLEGQIIMRHPEYNMQDRLLLNQIDYSKHVMIIDGKEYEIGDIDFPTIDPKNPYQLTPEEEELMKGFSDAFSESFRLQEHIHFLYEKGSIYKKYNGNLLFHGCIPLTKNGDFSKMKLTGKEYSGKDYMDYADRIARSAYFEHNQDALDFMWYLWCGKESPISGRVIKTVERMLLTDQSMWEEPRNPYYDFCNQEETCKKILREFGMAEKGCHIINGHTPVKVVKGESPIKANGLLFVIDGGFCRAYQKTTGIAGYTLIYNSHGIRLKAHHPFSNKEIVLTENLDIESDSQFIETFEKRKMIENTDTGKKINGQIEDLKRLLNAYRQGILVSKLKNGE